jgi:threonyl-tRNA synthetase
VSVRDRATDSTTEMTLEAFVAKVTEEIAQRA